MSKVIACVNEKGGVAKTTTVKNLAIGLAGKGKKVLVIDLDPSKNLTTSLGFLQNNEPTIMDITVGNVALLKDQVQNNEPTIMDILRAEKDCEDIPEDYAIMHQEEGIDVICSTTELHAFENELMYAMQREIILRKYVLTVKDKYDYVFIDCPAGLGIYVTNALFCADEVLIPVQPQFLGAEAMQNLFVYLNQIRKLNGTRTKPEILGILFTMVRINTNNDKDLMAFFSKNYKDKINIFDTYIPHSVRFSESDGEGQSIFKYAPKTSSAMVFGDFVNEFLKTETEQ